MTMLSKQQIGHWVLLDYASQRQNYQQKLTFFERKYNTDYQTFERNIEQAENENFEMWDDYIEWKAYRQFLAELLVKIEDIRNGHFQVA